MPALSKTAALAYSKAELAEMEALRKRAARQAQRNTSKEDIPTVDCEVLPQGDGKISMGQHFGGLGDAYYDEGETIKDLQLPVAIALYEKGFVKFDGAKEAAAEQRDRMLAAARERRDAAERAREEAEAADLQNYA